MSQVQVEQKSYQMPPLEGITVTHFITVADIERSARFYETVFGGRILSGGDSKGAPGYIQIANTWLIVNVGGGPTPDKPSVTLSTPRQPGFSQQLYEYPRGGYSGVLCAMATTRGGIYHGAKGQIRRNAPLHSRSRRLHYRSRTKQTGVHLRLITIFEPEGFQNYFAIHSGCAILRYIQRRRVAEEQPVIDAGVERLADMQPGIVGFAFRGVLRHSGRRIYRSIPLHLAVLCRSCHCVTIGS
ncbi:MAG: hypothetical protein WDN50_09405 [Bradyrhizobium sp.]